MSITFSTPFPSYFVVTRNVSENSRIRESTKMARAGYFADPQQLDLRKEGGRVIFLMIA